MMSCGIIGQYFISKKQPFSCFNSLENCVELIS